MELIIFILICYGASNIMVFSSIFENWRNFWVKHSPNFFGELFICMICLPFWWGVIISLFVYSPITFSGDYMGNWVSLFVVLFLNGCLASGSVWLLHSLQEFLEKK